MALIRNAQAQFAARDAVVLDLGDLKRQGDMIQASAAKRAESIIADAHARRDELIADAAEEGHRQGFARGFEEGRERGAEEGRAAAHKEASEELSGLAGNWLQAIDHFESQRDYLYVQSRLDVLRLCVRLAEKIVKRAVDVDETIVEGQLSAILSLLSRTSRLVVAVHPEDEALLREALPKLLARFAAAQHVEVIKDESLTRGGVVARTEAGAEIDASIDTQLERLAAAILPAEDALE